MQMSGSVAEHVLKYLDNRNALHWLKGEVMRFTLQSFFIMI
jgi:ribosomal protein S25